jgi:beta-lactamase regulating signal transducer with metallopeptidase domain/protocatechuate 3,4-dioxygenase beta subunit
MFDQLLRSDDPWLWMALEVTGKATLLLLIATILACLLGRFSAALRHRLWAMVFVALLMLPLASVWLPGLALPVIPRDWHLAPAAVDNSAARAAAAAEPRSRFFHSDPAPSVPHATADRAALDRAAPRDFPDIATPDVQPVATGVDSQPAARRSAGPWWLLVWLIGAVSVLIPLIGGLLGNLWMMRRGRPFADFRLRKLIDELMSDLALRRQVTLLLLPEKHMPMTFGFVRSYVVLPADALGWTLERLRMVVLHELAHVKRHDVSWQMVARVACALYWFHPLVWWALRRMRIDREFACDDCVLATGQKASRYATHLLEIARAHRSGSPLATAAIAMARRSQLEGRLLAVLDAGRARAPLGFGRAVTLLLLTALAVVSLGVLRLALRAQPVASASGSVLPATADEPFSGKPDETIDPAAIDSAGNRRPDPVRTNAAAVDDDPITIQGSVLDSAGEPLEDATVRLVQPSWNPEIEDKLVGETRSDKKGRFAFSYLRSQVTVPTRRPEECVVVCGFKPGYGIDWDWRINISPREQSELRLFVNDVAITGRLVDLEGRPLAGVRVDCREVIRPHGENLSTFIDAVKCGDLSAAAKCLQYPLSPLTTGLAPQRTDADGRFRLAGVGPEKVARLVFEGPSIARAAVTAVTRPLAPLVQSGTIPSTNSEPISLVGADFEISLPPARAIEGVVRDPRTGAVLPNVSIQSFRFAGPFGSGVPQIRVVSDEQGHFRLDGMPKGRGNKLLAISGDKQPYVSRAVEVPDEPGFEPVHVDVEMHRGIWITGRVTEQVTGKPVPMAELFYWPLRSNEYARALPEFPPGDADKVDGYQHRYHTAADGSVRLVGLPGPAVVGLLDAMDSYCLGQGAGDISAEKNDKGEFLTLGDPKRPSKNWPTAMKQINPARGTDSMELNFALDRGAQFEITSVDSARQPVSRVIVTGMTPDGTPDMAGNATFVANSFRPDEERTILLHHEDRGLGKVIRLRAGRQDRKLTVRLEACAKVTGRIVDKNQVPVPRAEIRFDVLPADGSSRCLPVSTTDADGRFENPAVLIGADYAVSAKPAKAGSVFHTVVKELSVDPCDTIDLGTIEITGDE